MKEIARLTVSGLTLVELLVALTILSVVIALTTGVLYNVQRMQRNLDVKYDMQAEAEKIKKEIEGSLRTSLKLISGTTMQIRFLDINGDTVEYWLRSDTFFENQRPLTKLPVDTLIFEYMAPDAGSQVCDYYRLDKDRNDRLDEQELHAVTSIGLTINLHSSANRLTKIHLKKQFAVRLRNIIKT